MISLILTLLFCSPEAKAMGVWAKLVEFGQTCSRLMMESTSADQAFPSIKWADEQIDQSIKARQKFEMATYLEQEGLAITRIHSVAEEYQKFRDRVSAPPLRLTQILDQELLFYTRVLEARLDELKAHPPEQDIQLRTDAIKGALRESRNFLFK